MTLFKYGELTKIYQLFKLKLPPNRPCIRYICTLSPWAYGLRATAVYIRQTTHAQGIAIKCLIVY